MTSAASNSAISSRTIGAIAVYISRAPSQSLARLASRARTIPEEVNFRIFGFRSRSSRIAKQSSRYVLCSRRSRGNWVRRAETAMAIARANSCAVRSLIAKHPYVTRKVGGVCASQRKLNRRRFAVHRVFQLFVVQISEHLNARARRVLSYVNLSSGEVR
jgi:hypothetical protein